MKRTLMLVPFLAAAFVATTPALATPAHPHQGYEQPYAEAPLGWRGSDPSFNYSPGLDQARRLGRCVEDLGYGRYEYCD
jgi:hypothetical protein